MSTRRIAYLFTSSRDEIFAQVQKDTTADTPLFGMNHMHGATALTAGGGIRAFLMVPRLLRYDVIIAQDHFALGYVVSICARLLRRNTKWLCLNMTLSTLLRRHAANPVRLFLLKKFWASYAGIICLSSEQVEDLVRAGIPRTRLTLVHFGVDTTFFKPTDTSSEQNLIVSVGRDAGRDYTTLFKAAEKTPYQYIVVAGHKNIPPDLPIPTNVSVLYNKSLAQVRDLYERARLVVVASKEADVSDGSDCSGQTVILDALASGKAVVATNRGWIKDYFTPGEDLLVVAPNNPEALARTIEVLWEDADRRGRLSVSGQTTVQANYTTMRFAEVLDALITTLA